MCKVTVLCLAYNHAPYIAQALEGFLAQEAPFDIEVLVHDDASTDGTTEIIRTYASRYPDLIKPVFQQENQYSKGIKISRDILMPLVRGEFVALCEGDDYWTDPHKLAKQVAALEAHPEIDICTHAAAVFRDDRLWKFYAPACRNRVIPVQEVILGGGNFVATNSVLIRADIWKLSTPFREVLFNDYSLQIQGSLRGGMLYLKDCMSVYRALLPGAWTSRHKSADAKVQFHRSDKAMLAALDAFTGGLYADVIHRRMDLYDAQDKHTKRLKRLVCSSRRGLIRMIYYLRSPRITSS